MHHHIAAEQGAALFGETGEEGLRQRADTRDGRHAQRETGEEDAEAGKAAARQTGLAMLATLRSALGSLDRIKRIVKTLGLVNCTPEFSQQPAVINGFSELMADVFGADAGVGARSAVGATSLPGNMAVEVEAIFEIE